MKHKILCPTFSSGIIIQIKSKAWPLKLPANSINVISGFSLRETE